MKKILISAVIFAILTTLTVSIILFVQANDETNDENLEEQRNYLVEREKEKWEYHKKNVQEGIVDEDGPLQQTSRTENEQAEYEKNLKVTKILKKLYPGWLILPDDDLEKAEVIELMVTAIESNNNLSESEKDIIKWGIEKNCNSLTETDNELYIRCEKALGK